MFRDFSQKSYLLERHTPVLPYTASTPPPPPGPRSATLSGLAREKQCVPLHVWGLEARDGRKSGGTGGRVPPPHVFSGGGTQYQMSPPPRPRFWGRMNFGRYNVVFLLVFFLLFWPISLLSFFFFFFFLLVRNVRDVGWVGLHHRVIYLKETYNSMAYTFWLARLSTQMALRKKKVSESPAHQFFWGLWGWRRSGKCVCPPPPPPTHTIRFGFAPLLESGGIKKKVAACGFPFSLERRYFSCCLSREVFLEKFLKGMF